MAAQLEYFFPGQCYEKVVINLTADMTCFRMAIGRVLSLLVVLGAVIVKVPQIIKILRASSVENLSYLAIIQELAAVTFTASYSFAKSFPFSAWGENFFIAVQVTIILSLMFYYNQNIIYLGAFAPVYGVLVWYLTSQYASLTLLSTLQGCVIPLVISSRLTQILTTYANGTTGQLSVITAYMNWSGTLIRIFTTIQETADILLVTTISSAFTANTIIMIQFYWYWNVDKTKKKA